MRHQPRVEERAAMPYIGIHARVSGEVEFRGPDPSKWETELAFLTTES
jgi:hypothetical protein